MVSVSGDTSNEPTEYFSVVVNSAMATPVDWTGTGTILTDEGTTTNNTPYRWLESHNLVTNGYDNADWSDVDGDGLYAWQEYRAGTDPTNKVSAFRIISVTPTWQIDWFGGTNAENVPFKLWYSTNIMNTGAWVFVTDVARSNAVLHTVRHANASNYWPKVYHRVTAP